MKKRKYMKLNKNNKISKEEFKKKLLEALEKAKIENKRKEEIK